MTAKFYFIPPRPTTQQVELQFWVSVKDSTNPTVLGTYLEKYPIGEFAPIARALIDHYERQLKLELAAREEERRRQEEEIRAAEVKRLENERQTREATLGAERERAELNNSQQAMRLEREHAELLARNEELRKALDQARLAQQATKAAEEQRIAAAKAAETAAKTAEETIAKQRDNEKSPTKLAALPRIEKPKSANSFDGNWMITWLRGPDAQNCGPKTTSSYPIRIEGGVIVGKSGAVSPAGSARWTQVSDYTRGRPVYYTGTFRASSGSGNFNNPANGCKGTFTARRN